MKKNNNKREMRPRYAAPQIIDTFSEEELLKKVKAFQWSNGGWINGWDNNPIWHVISPTAK